MDVDKDAYAYTKDVNLNLDNIPANKNAKGNSNFLLQNVVEFTIQVENSSCIGMMENPMKKSG
jgi:hypothetical protein